jgi:hypothetical protein
MVLARVGIDYHVEIETHFYSVPHRRHPSVDEARRHLAVELVHTTVHQHTSSRRRRYVDWTIERIRREAASIGPAVAEIVAASGRQRC